MKKITSTILRNFGRVFGVLALCSFAAAGTTFAGTITKSFEFGPGTPYTRSNVRTFPVPCRKPVTVTVKFQTLGTAGASNLVPITIELREPDTAPDQEGPLVQAKNITARTLEQIVTFSGQFRNRGCSLPWRVRVSHANEGAAPFLTTGSIKLDFNDEVRNLSFTGSEHDGFMSAGSSSTVNLGSTGGLEEGTIVLKGDWICQVAYVTCPRTIKLQFTLIDPNGTEVKTAEGYADRQSERDQGLAILTLTYRVTSCTPGQWKLKIKNLENVGSYFQGIYEKFTPDCP